MANAFIVFGAAMMEAYARQAWRFLEGFARGLVYPSNPPLQMRFSGPVTIGHTGIWQLLWW